MKPLLSIIIPTKNRQYTAVFAVESVLDIESDDIEVVIQDCSDDNSLEDLLRLKFEDDPRVKYFYSDSKPSLTDNWNLAIGNTSGKYICGIGDDDAVMPLCIEIANWMNQNSVDAVLGSQIVYIWKDAYLNSFSNGKITFSNFYSGEIFKVDIQMEFIKKAINCGFGYTDNLPNLYHGILRKELLEIHKRACGYYLSSTSFDVYNAFILASYTKKFYFIDIPITVRGVSGKSNTNRINSNKSEAHFKEFKKVEIPDTLPYILNVEVSIAESTIVALRDIERFDLIDKMNLAIVYSKIASSDLLNFSSLYKKYKIVNRGIYKENSFFYYFFKFFKNNLKHKSINLILKGLYKGFPSVNRLIEKFTSKRKVSASDIAAAISVLGKHLNDNQIAVRYNKEIEPLPYQKVPWD
jgi:glycosyltransferase involved in cell wall biosynthesis